MAYQNCNKGHSLLYFLKEEEKLKSIHGQDTTEKILEHWGEGEAPLSPLHRDQDHCIRKIGKVATH